VFGLDVTMTHVEKGTSTQLRFTAFPVRLGRNALNDIKLESGYCSQFHALLQLDGDRIQLVDLGSRNGTELPKLGRCPPNTSVDLEASNYQFKICDTLFEVSLFNLEDLPNSRRRGGVHDLAEEVTHTQMSFAGALNAHLDELYGGYRGAWESLYREIQRRFSELDPQDRMHYCEEIMVSHPLVALEPEFKRLTAGATSRSGISARSPTLIPIDEEVPVHESYHDGVASEGLRHLANWYLPGSPPPRSVEEVLGFLQSIQDTLDVFFKCFIPLRDGYKKFESEMDIRRGRAPQQNSVEAARDPQELARVLLDWRTARGDEQRGIENSFAELMTHQVAILNGVMKGVKSLLNELAPETLERELDGARRQGLQFGPFRFKQLWDLYVMRHGDLSAEDKHTYGLIFGPQFAEAYAQFAGAASATPTMEVHAIGNPQTFTKPPPPPDPSRH